MREQLAFGNFSFDISYHYLKSRRKDRRSRTQTEGGSAIEQTTSSIRTPGPQRIISIIPFLPPLTTRSLLDPTPIVPGILIRLHSDLNTKSKYIHNVCSVDFKYILWTIKVLSHEATCHHDKLPYVTCMFLCNSMPWLVAWIQISLNSCNTLWRQKVARTFHPLVWHALVTCCCDKSVNKPIAGIDPGRKDCRSNKLPGVTCMWFCHRDMSLWQVALRGRTLKDRKKQD